MKKYIIDDTVIPEWYNHQKLLCKMVLEQNI